MKTEEEILLDLRHDWKVDSVDQHSPGYWVLEDKSFDLRNLKTKRQLQKDRRYQLYLDKDGDQLTIKISDDESFYEIKDLKGKRLLLTCYFQSTDKANDLVRIMTINLSRE